MISPGEGHGCSSPCLVVVIRRHSQKNFPQGQAPEPPRVKEKKLKPPRTPKPDVAALDHRIDAAAARTAQAARGEVVPRAAPQHANAGG